MIKLNGYNSQEQTIQGYFPLDNFSVEGVEWSNNEKLVFKEMDRRFQTLQSVEVESLTITEGVADLSKGYYLHGIPVNSSVEEISSRREYGLCCVENFGLLESASEARLCLSVTKSDNIQRDCVVANRYAYYGSIEMLDMAMSIVPEVGFIIDNSVTHRTDDLRQLNFFEYIRDKDAFIKKFNPTDEELKILETVEKLSPKAKTVVTGMFRDSYEKFNWAAITGGVPSKFVVGIVVNKNLIDVRAAEKGVSKEEYYSQAIETAKICSELFNVPILDQSANIIYNSRSNVLGMD